MMDVSRYSARIVFSSTHPASPATQRKNSTTSIAYCIFSNFSTTHRKFRSTIFYLFHFAFILFFIFLFIVASAAAGGGFIVVFVFVCIFASFLSLLIYFFLTLHHSVTFRFVCVHCHFAAFFTRSLSIFPSLIKVTTLISCNVFKCIRYLTRCKAARG